MSSSLLGRGNQQCMEWDKLSIRKGHSQGIQLWCYCNNIENDKDQTIFENKMEGIDLKDISEIEKNIFGDGLDEDHLCKERFKMKFQGFHLELYVKEGFVNLVIISGTGREYILYEFKDSMF